MVLLALLCAALSAWAATGANQPLLWVALTAGFVIYAAAIAYRGIHKR